MKLAPIFGFQVKKIMKTYLDIPPASEDVTKTSENSAKNRDYRSPQLFVIGKAAGLIQQNTEGRLRDGAGGWYVWGT